MFVWESIDHQSIDQRAKHALHNFNIHIMTTCCDNLLRQHVETTCVAYMSASAIIIGTKGCGVVLDLCLF